MSIIGPIEPCLCGSGRTFETCCLNEGARAAQFYRSIERNSALAKLMRFASRPEFEENRKVAFEIFWGEYLAEEPDEDLAAVMKSELANIARQSWFVFDFDIPDGRTVLDRFVEQESTKLSAGELTFLDAMRDSHLRLYEILEAQPDQGIALRDLWDDRRLYVRQSAATRHLVVRDLIAGRLGPPSDGGIIFETPPYVFPASAKEGLVEDLRNAYRTFTGPSFREKGVVKFFKHMAPIVHYWWLWRVALRRLPRLAAGDGEPIVSARVIFDLLDRNAVTAALVDREDVIDRADGSYAWLERAGNFQRRAGTILVKNARVVFETISRKRAEKARDELPALLGHGIRFRMIRYQDVSWAFKPCGRSRLKSE
jgi:hypothetical protein